MDALRFTNAIQIYRRLFDNALYGDQNIGVDRHLIVLRASKPIVKKNSKFTKGKAEVDLSPLSLGHRSYLDDKAKPATSLMSFMERIAMVGGL